MPTTGLPSPARRTSVAVLLAFAALVPAAARPADAGAHHGGWHDEGGAVWVDEPASGGKVAGESTKPSPSGGATPVLPGDSGRPGEARDDSVWEDDDSGWDDGDWQSGGAAPRRTAPGHKAPARRRAPAPRRKAPARSRTPTRRPAGARDPNVPYGALIAATARRHDISVALFTALVRQESGFRPTARSRAGARGLTQLMPATARGLGVRRIYDPRENLDGGARYLRQQLVTFRSVRLALAAYNAGPGAVRRFKGVPPYAETRNYVVRILRDAKRLRSAGIR
jgi:hypothetical protein